MQIILGANGVIGRELSRNLVSHTNRLRQVSRGPDPAPKTSVNSTVCRISPDGRARRVYLGLRLGRTPSATRTDGISGLALDPRGRIHFGAIINEASGSQIRRLDEATGVAAVVAGTPRPTDVAVTTWAF